MGHLLSVSKLPHTLGTLQASLTKASLGAWSRWLTLGSGWERLIIEQSENALLRQQDLNDLFAFLLAQVAFIGATSLLALPYVYNG